MKSEFQIRVREKYRDQIATLIKRIDEDDRACVDKSASDFWKFIKLHPILSECQLFLNNDLRIRAVWNDQAGDCFSMSFHGDKTATYVVKRINSQEKRPEDKRVCEGERVRLIEISNIIKKHELTGLMYRKVH